MTKPPHLAETSGDPQPSEAAPTYTVGYGRPPLHSRVKPGQILNKRGRPKGQKNVSTVLRKALNERTRIREGNRTRSVTKLDAIILKMINDAGMGNAKVQASLIALMRAVGMVGLPDEPTHQEPLTANDAAVIAEYLERNRSKVMSADQSESPEPLETEGGKSKEAGS
jgi:hypothetical protein